MQSKCCAECMYYNKMYCMRKKDTVEENSFCLHYVSSMEQHSMDRIVSEMVALIRKQKRRGE